MKRTWILLMLGFLLLIGTACAGENAAGEATEPGNSVRLAPVSALSPQLRQLSPEGQEAYRFALANRDVLEKIPCYCGCGSVGHMDNYMCYVQSESADGQVVFDYHGAG